MEKVNAKQVIVITVQDPVTNMPNDVVIYREDGGNMTGVDASYVEQEVGDVHSSAGNGILDIEA